MKLSAPLQLLSKVALVSLLVFAGCVGGGGGGVVGGGGAQDPGQDPGAGGSGFNPAVIDAARHVGLKGAVVTLRSSGPEYDPLPGVTVTVTSGGETISQTMTGPDGIYRGRLLRGRDNVIRPSKPGYRFEREEVSLNPDRPRIVEFIAKSLLAAPGGGPQQVDDPIEVGNQQPGPFPAAAAQPTPGPVVPAIARPTPRPVFKPIPRPTPSLNPTFRPLRTPSNP